MSNDSVADARNVYLAIHSPRITVKDVDRNCGVERNVASPSIHYNNRTIQYSRANPEPVFEFLDGVFQKLGPRRSVLLTVVAKDGEVESTKQQLQERFPDIKSHNLQVHSESDWINPALMKSDITFVGARPQFYSDDHAGMIAQQWTRSEVATRAAGNYSFITRA